jgi:hypothetical protein
MKAGRHECHILSRCSAELPSSWCATNHLPTTNAELLQNVPSSRYPAKGHPGPSRPPTDSSSYAAIGSLERSNYYLFSAIHDHKNLAQTSGDFAGKVLPISTRSLAAFSMGTLQLSTRKRR